ncbi:unnamed protein product [Sphenostylis stenocarpa]|uniref:Uncharacterized protein n=1 Tax=Sphenostylis stenocarpa TaxID=92480 RepID=A0AA86RRW9_9FABA|nr:unnamed protein product [Sphenostylis stenocarpa]
MKKNNSARKSDDEKDSKVCKSFSRKLREHLTTKEVHGWFCNDQDKLYEKNDPVQSKKQKEAEERELAESPTTQGPRCSNIRAIGQYPHDAISIFENA